MSPGRPVPRVLLVVDDDLAPLLATGGRLRTYWGGTARLPRW